MKKQLILSKVTVLTFCLMLMLLTSSQSLAGVSITIINTDGPNEGFNDATPAAPVGGNPGTTKGQQRLIAFQHAANIWGATLDSKVPIVIQASFDPLAPNVLGSAGATQVFAGFSGEGFNPGAEFQNTWYHSALADKRAGFDLNPGPDIVTRFNSNFNFYLGIDNNHGAQPDLVAVLLHEFGHGLGFSNFVNESSGSNLAGLTDVYSRHTLDTTTGKYWDQMTQAERASSALNYGRVVWDGTNVNAGAPNVLSLGAPQLRVNSPTAITGTYLVGTASFGPALTTPSITGNLVQALDATDAAGPSASDGCSPITNAAAVAGNIALLDRGACGFVVKVKNAQNAGAIAVVIADNAVGSPPPGMSGADPTITIPSVRITLQDGNAIKTQLPNVNVSLGIDMSVRTGADTLGRVRLFMPNPVQGGSSGSHYDSFAFRNLLMEPSINGDLTHNLKAPDDLTLELMRDIGWFADADLDGIASDVDCNPDSNLTTTVVIGGNDSGVPNTLFSTGCTISDLIAQIAASSRNHGKFVSGVAQLANNLLSQGVITSAQKDAIMSAAGGANIP